MELMSALQRMSPRRGLFGPIATDGDRPTMFALAVGDRRLADALAAGDDPRTHAARIEREVKAFLARREKCLLYK
jgi:hypothetical protein